MTFDGATTCPACGADLARDLRDVLRKAEDRYECAIECPACDVTVVVKARIVHHVEIVRDEDEA
jgi:hypothetical protein